MPHGCRRHIVCSRIYRHPVRILFDAMQCKERFLANPHLYIGFPGHKAPAQQGVQVIKQRRMLLAAPLNREQSARVKSALLAMMGIKEVRIEDAALDIQYDLLQVTAEQIAEKLGTIGTQLGGNWVERLKLAFINYQEEGEIGSLELEDKNPCH